MWKIILSGGGAKREIAVVKLKRGKNLSAGILFYTGFCSGVSGDGPDDGGILFKWRCKCVEYAACDGGHGTDGPLPNFLNYISTRRRRSIVTATGNEANTRHHFQGALRREMDYEDVEISVEQDMAGFFIELWAGAPELYAISVISPTGERIPKVSLRSGASKSFRFVFEGTTVSVDYRIETKETANQLIYLRFSDVRRGLWIVRVYPENIVSGNYNMWLPMQKLTDGNVIFLRSNPDTTLTAPGTAAQVITVGGYQVSNNSMYADSGRGYTVAGGDQAGFCGTRGECVRTGAAWKQCDLHGNQRRGGGDGRGGRADHAVGAGAAERSGDVQRRDQNMLIRGAKRSEDRGYPNREWGIRCAGCLSGV